MINQTRTRIEVSVLADPSPAALFAVLQQPGRHTEIDGSGMLRGAVNDEPITGSGQVFTMNMHYDALGDYRTDNHVVEFEQDHLITWTTANEGQQPAGVRWGWEFTPEGGRTRIVHSYDWTHVEDPAVLERVSFPRVSGEQLRQTVRALVAAAS